MIEMKLKSGNLLRIKHDTNPDDPRSWDNLGYMMCWHRRYNLGDENPYNNNHDMLVALSVTHNDELTEKDLLDFIQKTHVILPLFLYDHSGITMRTSPFSCKWDSGQVGWIFCSEEDACKALLPTHDKPSWSTKVKRPGTEEFITLRDHVKEILIGEVETYDQFLTGEVYGFQIIHKEKCEHCGHVEEQIIDSCGGFFGSNINENGMLDHIGDDEILDLNKP